MDVTSFPTGLPDAGYSMQAAAIASALIERENAAADRVRLRKWLDKIEDPHRPMWIDLEEGRYFAEFLTNLVRKGSGLPPRAP